MNAPGDARIAQLELNDSRLFRQQRYIDGAWLDADDKSTTLLQAARSVRGVETPVRAATRR